MISRIQLGRKTVGDGFPPYVIAEVSGNHNHSLENALGIVEAAAAAGANAIKLQTYTPDTLTLNSFKKDFYLPGNGNPWAGQRLWELYQDAYTPWEWHLPIFEKAREKGLDCISTAFDKNSVAFLTHLGVDALKIASFELIHIPLIRAVAQTNHTLLISTGMGSKAEIQEAVEAVLGERSEPPILLKCTSAYPSKPIDAHVRTLPEMREAFGTLVGLSDHSMTVSVAATATALGACVVEKHLTLSRDAGGPDASFSLEPNEFRDMVNIVRECFDALGDSCFGQQAVEAASGWERPSIWVTKDIQKGDIFTPENIKILRPSGGLLPREYPKLLGCKSSMDIPAETPLEAKHLD